METSFNRVDLNSQTLPSKTAPRPIISVDMALSPTPRAFFFDVFGTCVDWRKSITSNLCKWAHKSLNDTTASLASQLRLRVSAMTEDDWGRFAQDWRNCYKAFTKQLAEFSEDSSEDYPYMTIDDCHRKSLRELMAKWELQGLWDAFDTAAVSWEWHHLEPWDDAVLGVQMLNQLCGRPKTVATCLRRVANGHSNVHTFKRQLRVS